MPFSTEMFMNVFKAYNTMLFPVQIILNLLAVICLLMVIKNMNTGNRIISGILSFLWLWSGVVFNFIFFSSINKAAYLFGILFIVQAAVFFYSGVLKNRFNFKRSFDRVEIAAWILIAYSLIVYPILGYTIGHAYPKQPTFGLPCPTTIFSFGMLLFTIDRLRWQHIIIPVLWSIIGFTAVIRMGVIEDIGLLVSGLLCIAILYTYKKYHVSVVSKQSKGLA